MNVLFIILSFLFFSKIYAVCPDYLIKYPEDCAIYERYNTQKDSFQKRGVDVENISFYRMSRFISGKDIKQDSDSNYYPWRLYSPSPATWNNWEIGESKKDDVYKNIQDRFLQNKAFELTIDDMAQLHSAAITNELRGVKGKIPVIVPKSGVVRSNVDLTPSFFAGHRLSSIEEYALKELPGVNYTKEGYVSYVKSKDVPKELSDFIQETNKLVNDIKNNTLEKGKTPLGVISYLQRKYVSIHPFHEGVGRTSRFLQDIICKHLGFPYLSGGMLQNDVLTPYKDYAKNTYFTTSHMLNFLEACLQNKPFFKNKCVELYVDQKDRKNLDFDREESRLRKGSCSEYLVKYKKECEIQKMHNDLMMKSMEQMGGGDRSGYPHSKMFVMLRSQDPLSWMKGEKERLEILNEKRIESNYTISPQDIFKLYGLSNMIDVHKKVSSKDIKKINDLAKLLSNSLDKYRKNKGPAVSPYEFIEGIDKMVKDLSFVSKEKEKNFIVHIKDLFLESLNLPPVINPKNNDGFFKRVLDKIKTFFFGNKKNIVDEYKKTYAYLRGCFSPNAVDRALKTEDCSPVSIVQDHLKKEDLSCFQDKNVYNISKKVNEICEKVQKTCDIEIDDSIGAKKDLFLTDKKGVIQLKYKEKNVYSVTSNDICNFKYGLNSRKVFMVKEGDDFSCLSMTSPNTCVDKNKKGKIVLEKNENMIECMDNAPYVYKWDGLNKECRMYLNKIDDGSLMHIYTLKKGVSCEDAQIVRMWTAENLVEYKYNDKCEKIVKTYNSLIEYGKMTLKSFYTKTNIASSVGGKKADLLFENVRMMDDVIDRISKVDSVKTPGILFRGEKGESHYMVGDQLNSMGFMSTAKVASNAAGFLGAYPHTVDSPYGDGSFLIYVKNRGHGIDISDGYFSSGEEEYLFGRGQLKGVVAKVIRINRNSTREELNNIIFNIKKCVNNKSADSISFEDNIDKLLGSSIVFVCPSKEYCLNCDKI